MVNRLKVALERTLSEELRGAVEHCEASFGRLQRERTDEIAWRATYTGVVVQQ